MRLPRPDLSTPRKRLRFLLLAGAVFVFLMFFLAVSLPLASNPTFCGTACHSQNPEYRAWQRSSHAKVTCYACHMDKLSISHLLTLKLIDAPLGILQTVTNSLDKPINAKSEYSQKELPADRCERCHSNENRRFTFSRGIYMNHKAHKKAGIACAVCHNRVAHRGAENFEPLKSEWREAKGFRYKDFTTMKDGCFRCHSANRARLDEETLALIQNGRKPPRACTTCHTRDFALPIGHEKGDWRSGHGPVARRDFGYCFSCHEEGEKFTFEGRTFCLLCHDEKTVAGFSDSLISGQTGSSQVKR